MRRVLGALIVLAGCSEDPDPGPIDERLLEHPALASCRGEPASTFTVASWNMGAARRRPLEDVQETLAELDADVVLLQENDVFTDRTGMVHQPAELAEALGYDYAFAEALPWDNGLFGLSVLTRLPFHRVRRRSMSSTIETEPRIALDVQLCNGDEVLRFVNVHAEFEEPANAENLEDLAEQLGRPSGFVLVAGDFNALPETDAIATFAADTELIDVLATRDPSPTHRNKRVDYAFATTDVEAALTDGATVESRASDHDALLLTFDRG